MKSETFNSTDEVLEHFQGKPLSAIFQSSSTYPEGHWRIRNSGVWGYPENSAETLAVLLTCKSMGIELERSWSATPLNPDSFRI